MCRFVLLLQCTLCAPCLLPPPPLSPCFPSACDRSVYIGHLFEACHARNSAAGYHVRLDAATTAATRLLFCTTGILLRRLASDPTLARVSHVIVDEVRWRSFNERHRVMNCLHKR